MMLNMINRRLKYQRKKAGSERGKWLLTFNDLMTLLMVFFVLLFSMGSANVKEIRVFQYSLQSGLGVIEAGDRMEVGVVDFDPNNKEVNGETINSKIREDIKESINKLNSIAGVKAIYTKEGVVIRLENTIVFSSGTADISREAFKVLTKITSIINKISSPIRIEGHTDNIPIHTKIFPSNWELSTSRAVNVVKYFIDEGNITPVRLSAVGYGASKPISSNDTYEHRAINRRVEIVLLTEGGE